MGKIVVCDHPLIQHKLTFIRDENTKTKDFRQLVDEVAMLMAYEITRELPLEEVDVHTPGCTSKRESHRWSYARFDPNLASWTRDGRRSAQAPSDRQSWTCRVVPRSGHNETCRVLC